MDQLPTTIPTIADATVQSIDTVLAGFPHQQIAPILGKPTHANLSTPLKLLGFNAQSLVRPDGADEYGHLNLIRSDISYLSLPQSVVLPLLIMPANPVFGGTQAKIAERQYYHSIAKSNYLNQVAYMGALKQQIIRLIQPEFLDDLNHHITGFNAVIPKQPHYAPSKITPPTYGAKQQLTRELDTTPELSKKQVKLLQQVTSKFLYYARAVDGTMLHALNELASATHKGTQKTAIAMNHFLNYCSTHPNTVLLYRASEMILMGDSDAAYLVAAEACSRAGGYIYLGNKASTNDLFNGAVLLIARIIKMSWHPQQRLRSVPYTSMPVKWCHYEQL